MFLSRRSVGWLLVLGGWSAMSGCGGSTTSENISLQEPTPTKQAAPDVPKSTTDEAMPAIDSSLDIESLLQSRLTADELSVGWIRLFDGQSLFGWRATSNADWRVENSEIIVEKGEPGFLQTTSQFADFELHIEFQCSNATNSGVFLRSVESPTDPAKDCIELNIAPSDNPFRRRVWWLDKRLSHRRSVPSILKNGIRFTRSWMAIMCRSGSMAFQRLTIKINRPCFMVLSDSNSARVVFVFATCDCALFSSRPRYRQKSQIVGCSIRKGLPRSRFAMER